MCGQKFRRKWSFLFSCPQPEPEPELIPSPPVDSQPEEAKPEKSTREEGPTEAQNKDCDSSPKEKTPEPAKSGSDSAVDERKHDYKMAFVKSA